MAASEKSAEALKEQEEEQKGWEEALDLIQQLRPARTLCDQIKTRDIPALEKQIREKEATQPDLVEKLEDVCLFLYLFDNVKAGCSRYKRVWKGLRKS
jgi:DNA repair protein RAD50